MNNSAPIMLGVGPSDDGNSYRKLIQLFEGSPGGGTPLCRHIQEVTTKIKQLEPQLRANGHKAVLIINTDGESSDGDLAQAMKPLQGLPVWVVVRLCTDDDKISSYWENIDNQLELNMDVLDDFVGEAKEVYSKNPWLTYGEPLHRLREIGIRCKEIDLLDEVSLSKDQIRLIASLM